MGLSKVTRCMLLRFIVQDKMNQVTMVYIVAGEATQLIMNAMILINEEACPYCDL